MRRTRAVPSSQTHTTYTHTNMGGRLHWLLKSQAEGSGVRTETPVPRRGAGAIAPAALCDRNRGLERPSNGWEGASESEPTNPLRRHTKQPGVERVPAVKAPASRSRSGQTTYINTLPKHSVFREGTPKGTASETRIATGSHTAPRSVNFKRLGRKLSYGVPGFCLPLRLLR